MTPSFGRTGHRGHCSQGVLLAVALIVCLRIDLSVAAPLAARAGTESAAVFQADAKTLSQGATLFRQECVYCHGVSARGGMRGPDLTTGSWTHGGTDADLSATIVDGIQGTAMPPHKLTQEEVRQIIAYLRSLQQPVAQTAGDASRGEALFFGSQRCSSCHIVNGRGGRLGPELSTVGSGRSRAYLVESIREPGRRLTENHSFGDDYTLRYDTVTVVTSDGTTIVGVPMNEDTFTVQVMDTTEHVHSLDKKSLRSLRHEDRSLMPAYGVNRLSNAELDDLLAYLQTLRAATTARKGPSHD
jgi:cytochrome c oxidase cbb3-type subunit 3